ncbi:MAG: hypothetical protein ACR2GK_05210 [Gemmatimonadaceae bacterium]
MNDGLIIEGIGTTIDWNASDVPFAVGLIQAQPGLQPRKMEDCLPLPLLWRHEWDKPLGSMFAASATETAVHFRACIVPPGTPGYDGDLLFRVWDDVRSGAAPAVSFASHAPARDGAWRGSELSVTPAGGNPFAIITRATFPDGHTITREAPAFTREAAQLAWLKFNEGHKQARAAALQTRNANTQPGDDAPVPAVYLGTWKSDSTYQRGHMVTDKGVLWHCESNNVSGRPRDTPGWKLMHKSMEKGGQGEAA